jgi:hypothetical protein
MGYLTVALVLNDLASELEKSPKTAAWLLSHAPMHYDDKNQYRRTADEVSRENNEPRLHSQALEVVPTFHADETHYFRVGQNDITDLKFLGYERRNGKRVVVLEIDDQLDKWIAEKKEQY